MKYAEIELQQRESIRHPMHQFVVDNDGYTETRLLGSSLADGEHTAIFHVNGWPPDPYETALRKLDSFKDCVLSEHADRTFSVYVRETLSSVDQDITGTFDRRGLVTMYPIVFTGEGSLEIQLVGPAEVLQSALDGTPEGTAIEIKELGDYNTRRVGDLPSLTDRQFEALAAAVDCGYYQDPREGTVTAVANALDCSTSTAAEHLRRAERRIMQSFVQ